MSVEETMALPQQGAEPQTFYAFARARLPHFRAGKTNQEQIVLAITITLVIVFGFTLNGLISSLSWDGGVSLIRPSL
jgi:hypothetical protein